MYKLRMKWCWVGEELQGTTNTHGELALFCTPGCSGAEIQTRETASCSSFLWGKAFLFLSPPGPWDSWGGVEA